MRTQKRYRHRDRACVYEWDRQRAEARARERYREISVCAIDSSHFRFHGCERVRLRRQRHANNHTHTLTRTHSLTSSLTHCDCLIYLVSNECVTALKKMDYSLHQNDYSSSCTNAHTHIRHQSHWKFGNIAWKNGTFEFRMRIYSKTMSQCCQSNGTNA